MEAVHLLSKLSSLVQFLSVMTFWGFRAGSGHERGKGELRITEIYNALTRSENPELPVRPNDTGLRREGRRIIGPNLLMFT